MARKRRKLRYVVTRNGEHVAWPEDREAAETALERVKAEDVECAHKGWITLRQLELTRYYIEVH